MVMGMTYDQFWEGDPRTVVAYRESDKLKRRRRNEELWLEGVYMVEALRSTVGNMFSKGTKYEYPVEPFAITEDEQNDRKEREQKAKVERMKAAFMAKALRVNARMGGKPDDGN